MDSVYLDGALSISRIDFPEIVQLCAWKGQETALSTWVKKSTGVELPKAGSSNMGEDTTVISIGPRRWLAGGEGVVALIDDFDQNLGTVLDLSSARTLFRLRGDNLTWLLNKGTSVDLSAAVTPDGSVVMTTIDHIGVTIHKIGQDAFDLYTFSSFGDAMEHWLEVSSNDLAFEG